MHRYPSVPERRRRPSASCRISRPAEHLHHAEIGVRPLYEIVLARFNRTARIRDFLTVLVSRRVTGLMRMRMTEHASPRQRLRGKAPGSSTCKAGPDGRCRRGGQCNVTVMFPPMVL